MIPVVPASDRQARGGGAGGAVLLAGAALAVVLAVPACATAQDSPPLPAYASDQRHGYRVVTVAEGLENPWGLAFLPDGGMLVTERPGRLRLIRDGVLQPEPVAGVPEVFARGQGGLLDVALHPDFASNRLVYLSYSKPGPQGATTAVSRGRLEGNRLADVQEIFEAKAWAEAGQHFGSRLVFDRDGYLFVTIGDRGDRTDLGPRQKAQDRSNHAGTTLRLHDDGRVPADNPFVGQAGVLPEIYTYGNRSPQGLVLHPTTGELWQTEHGPRGGDEINLIRAGRNYGWPVVTYGINYNTTSITDQREAPGMEPPLLQWTPSPGVAGITIYQGSAFPRWQGDVFVAALVGQHVTRVTFEGTRPVRQEKLVADLGHRFRDVRTGPDGFLYLLADSRSGTSPILRLEPDAR
jgi:aldose sugar dehydrogenase